MPSPLDSLHSPRSDEQFAHAALNPSRRPEILEYSASAGARAVLRLPANGLFEALRARMPSDIGAPDIPADPDLSTRPSFEKALRYEERRQAPFWRAFDQIGFERNDPNWRSALLWHGNHQLTRRIFTTETLLIPYDSSVFSDPPPGEAVVRSPRNWHLFGFHRDFGCPSCFGFLIQDAVSTNGGSHWVVAPVRPMDAELWKLLLGPERDSREMREIRELAPRVLASIGEMSSISTHDGAHSVIFPVFAGREPPSHYFTHPSAPLYSQSQREHLPGWRMWGGDSTFGGFQASRTDGQPSFDAYERFSLLLYRMICDRREEAEPQFKPGIIRHGEEFLKNLGALGEIIASEYDSATAAKACGHFGQAYLDSFYLMVRANDPALDAGLRGPSFNELLRKLPTPEFRIELSDLPQVLWAKGHEVCSTFRLESYCPRGAEETSESYSLRLLRAFLSDPVAQTGLTAEGKILAGPIINAYGAMDSFTAAYSDAIPMSGGEALRCLTLAENDGMHLKIFERRLYPEVCRFVSDYAERFAADYGAWKRSRG